MYGSGDFSNQNIVDEFVTDGFEGLGAYERDYESMDQEWNNRRGRYRGFDQCDDENAQEAGVLALPEQASGQAVHSVSKQITRKVYSMAHPLIVYSAKYQQSPQMGNIVYAPNSNGDFGSLWTDIRGAVSGAATTTVQKAADTAIATTVQKVTEIPRVQEAATRTGVDLAIEKGIATVKDTAAKTAAFMGNNKMMLMVAGLGLVGAFVFMQSRKKRAAA